MPEERHPTDAELLALTQDPATGVDYIPTGKSPYHLDYRRSLHRTLRAAERANDLRVYIDDDLSVGVRPGRCFIADGPVDFAGEQGIAVPINTTTTFWLDAAGDVQSSSSGLPADRATFVPLAEAVTDATAITSLTDLRGEAFLQAPSAAVLGLTATAGEINQALDGINPSVTDLALNTLTAGPAQAADSFHTHTILVQDLAGLASFTLANDSDDPAADLSLRFSLPELLPYDTLLKANPSHHFLEQTYGPTTHTLVGSTHADFLHPGDLTASFNDLPIGLAPLHGEIAAVVLTVATNLQSSTAGDGLAATIKVNGTTATDTPAQLTSAAGPGFACTDRGDGTAATLKTDGSATVARGDLLSLDLTRTAIGTVSAEASDVGVLVVIRAARPE